MLNQRSLLVAGLLAAGLVGVVDAVPYASLVKIQSTTYVSGSTNAITYVLNEAPGGTAVTIDILDSSDAVVATFAGTATSGLNTVNWNGRVDNAAGALVPDGTGYKVRVTVAGPTQGAWTTFAANQSSNTGALAPDIPAPFVATMYADSFPKDVQIQQDPDSDFFGTVLVSTGYGTNATGSAWTVLNTALEPVGGDPFAGRVLRHPKDIAQTLAGGDTYNVWGGAWDPVDANRFWSVGQDGTVEILSADNTGGTGTAGLANALVDADPTHIAGASYYPRTVTVHEVAAQKYLFIARGNSTISAVAIDGSNQVSAAPVNIAAFATTNRYSKAIRFDSDGNLYYVSRRVGTVASGGALYRWSAAKVAAALSGTPTPLSEANADWDIQITVDAAGATDEEVMSGVTIAPDGTVYAMESDDGIYSLGDKSQATLTGALQTVGTLVVDFRTLVTNDGVGMNTSDAFSSVVSDAYGNLYIVSGSNETVWGFSPPAASATNIATVAPGSQAVQIITVASTDQSWSLYE